MVSGQLINEVEKKYDFFTDQEVFACECVLQLIFFINKKDFLNEKLEHLNRLVF